MDGQTGKYAAKDLIFVAVISILRKKKLTAFFTTRSSPASERWLRIFVFIPIMYGFLCCRVFERKLENQGRNLPTLRDGTLTGELAIPDSEAVWVCFCFSSFFSVSSFVVSNVSRDNYCLMGAHTSCSPTPKVMKLAP